MEKIININGREILVKEIKYKDFSSLQGLTNDQVGKRMIQLSTGLNDEEYDNLNLKDGIHLIQLVNEVNGLVGDGGNFQAR